MQTGNDTKGDTMTKTTTVDEVRAALEALADLEAAGQDLREGDYALEQPTTRRLHTCIIVGCNAGVHASRWSSAGEPWPRLALTWTTDEGGADTNTLWIYAPGQFSQDSALGGFCQLWGDGHRFGTWARYRLEVERAGAMIRELGWTLTTDERALMDALEEYGRQAPARYAKAS